MINIGIQKNEGLVFEGNTHFGRVLWPAPVITSAKIVSPTDEDLSAQPDNEQFGYIFREDYFDPVTRIRRGRFYHSTESLTQQWFVRPNQLNPLQRRDLSLTVSDYLSLETYQQRNIWYHHIKGKTELPLVFLGTGERYTVWQMVDIEVISTGEELVTLKARSNLGVLPRLKIDRIPEKHLGRLREALSTFVDEVHRSSPASVVDRARDVAIQAILSYYDTDDAVAEDLGALVKKLRRDELSVPGDAANLIARLHARCKPNEQAKRKLPAIREQDAELATQCVGTILCELGLAGWR